MSFCSYYEEKVPFFEAYDMIEDPYQLNNIAYDLPKEVFNAFKAKVKSMFKCKGRECSRSRSSPIM